MWPFLSVLLLDLRFTVHSCWCLEMMKWLDVGYSFLLLSILGAAFRVSNRSISVTWRLDDSSDHIPGQSDPLPRRGSLFLPDSAPPPSQFSPLTRFGTSWVGATGFCSSGNHGDRRRARSAAVAAMRAEWLMTGYEANGQNHLWIKFPVSKYNSLPGKVCSFIQEHKYILNTTTVCSLGQKGQSLWVVSSSFRSLLGQNFLLPRLQNNIVASDSCVANKREINTWVFGPGNSILTTNRDIWEWFCIEGILSEVLRPRFWCEGAGVQDLMENCHSSVLGTNTGCMQCMALVSAKECNQHPLIIHVP